MINDKSPHQTMYDISENLGYINRAITDIDKRIARIETRINHTVTTRTLGVFLGIVTSGIFLWLSALTTIVVTRR